MYLNVRIVIIIIITKDKVRKVMDTHIRDLREDKDLN